jgi:uncharacterized protein (TIGR03067 family)
MTNDLDLLQGSWSVTALKVDGQDLSDTLPANARIVIKRDRFKSTGMGAEYEGTLKLVIAARLRQIDMKFDKGPEKGNTNLGIYKLDGNTWKMCLATRGTTRPSKFASTPGSGFAVETLTRGDAPVRSTMTKTKTRASRKARARNRTRRRVPHDLGDLRRQADG